MALNGWKWFVALILGCLVLTGIIGKPPKLIVRRQPGIDDTAWTRYAIEKSKYDSIGDFAQTTSEVVRMLQLRDSVRTVLASTPVRTPAKLAKPEVTDARVDVRIDAAFSAADAALADSVVRVVWAKLLTEPPRVPIVTAVILDSVSRVRDASRILRYSSNGRAFIPQAGSAEPCLVIIAIPTVSARGRTMRDRAPLWPRGNMGRLFGPCAYAARYGAPGPAAYRWMVANREWFEDIIWIGATRLTTEQRFGPRQESQSINAGIVGAACVKGKMASCGRLALGRAGIEASLVSDSVAGIAAAGESVFDLWVSIGRESGTLVGDMHESIGDEAFRRLWQSPKAFPDAFRDAAGKDLDAWTRDWAIAKYGPDTSESRIKPRLIILTMIEVLACIGLALYVGERRRVT